MNRNPDWLDQIKDGAEGTVTLTGTWSVADGHGAIRLILGDGHLGALWVRDIDGTISPDVVGVTVK